VGDSNCGEVLCFHALRCRLWSSVGMYCTVYWGHLLVLCSMRVRSEDLKVRMGGCF